EDERPLAGECRLLFEAREKRIHPHKDDKILTGWNGLMIAALAFGSRVLGEDRYAQAAARAVAFITAKLRRPDGRLLARYRDGEAAYPAYADDYTYLTWGLIELFQATHDPAHLELALELTSDLVKYFWDSQQGGLFLYGSDSEELFTRPKEIYDGATPSANSVAALNFLRLGRLTGRQDLEDYTIKMFQTFGGNLNLTPMGHTHFMQAVWWHRSGGIEVTLVGNPQADDLREMLQEVNRPFAPELLLTVKNGGDGKALEELMPQVTDRVAVEGRATAYVCTGFACQPPVTDSEALAALVQA
ncbi:MAG TPA: thioredoxin domain-containing protein, partial [Bacillota bacterium]|nr:thioredoxin domain-containing protein [Bacillota bacterium]